jgi:hypothetical protein
MEVRALIQASAHLLLGKNPGAHLQKAGRNPESVSTFLKTENLTLLPGAIFRLYEFIEHRNTTVKYEFEKNTIKD